jgi:hypothetical protein
MSIVAVIDLGRMKVVSTKGNITGLLKKEYQQQGYVLKSDNHFYELYIPGKTIPKIFPKHDRTTMVDISKFIEEQNKTI